MKTCAHCGRPVGDAFEQGECACPGSNACRASTVGLDAVELRRELADAKAEVERLNRVLEDEAIEASAALRSEMAILLSAGSCESPEDAAQRVMRELADARSELSELRAALAAAAMASSPERGEALEGYSLRCVQRYPDGSYRAVFDHPSEEPVGLPLFGGASLGRSTFDDMAEKAGPLPTAVLAQTEASIDLAGALTLLRRLDGGGCLVPTSALTPAQITIARAADRMWVDSRGYGYVYVPGPKGVE